MTPLMFQWELVEELKKMFRHHLYKQPGTKELVPIHVFEQELPMNESDDDDDPAPYIIVRLSDGDDPGTRDSFNTVKLVIIIGIWDDDLEAHGHRDVLNIIQKIYERFQTNPNLNGVAVSTGEFHWAIQQDGYFPYFFGACSMEFRIAALRREDRFS